MVTETYHSMLQTLVQRLENQQSPDAFFQAQELLAQASCQSKAQLLQQRHCPLPPTVAEKTLALLSQCIQGKPLAYVLGQWDFYGMTFQLNAHTLIPRIDTEVLVTQVLALAKTLPEKNLRILDLCAGSGCIGIALAKHLPHAQVVLGEISPQAREMCLANTTLHQLEQRVSTQNLDALSPPASGEQFHLLVSNPPYISQAEMAELDPSVADYEPHLALAGGKDGYDFYHSILSQWTPCLLPQGSLFFEVGIGQADQVKTLMETQGFLQVKSHNDSQNIPRVLAGQKA